MLIHTYDDGAFAVKVSDFGLAKVRPDPKTVEKDTFLMTGETGSYRFSKFFVFGDERYFELRV